MRGLRFFSYPHATPTILFFDVDIFSHTTAVRTLDKSHILC